MTLIVAIMIACSVVATASIIATRFNRYMKASLIFQGNHIASALTVAANDMILADDVFALERFLKERLASYPSLAYLFVSDHGEIQAHAFQAGLPEWIQLATLAKYTYPNNYVRYQSENGSDYVHIASPLLSDRAKILHVGLDERLLLSPAFDTWLPTVLVGILVIVSVSTLAFFLIRRMIFPLHRLAQTVEAIDPNKPRLECPTSPIDEVNVLQSAFSRMIEQMQDTSRQLDKRATDLDFANRRVAEAFKMVRTVGNHKTLRDVSAHLIGNLSYLVNCRRMAILSLDRAHNQAYIYADKRFDNVPANQLTRFWTDPTKMDTLTFIQTEAVGLPSELISLKTAHRLGVFPIHFENERVGALIVGCPKNCECYTQQSEMITLILHECASNIHRAIHYTADLDTIQCQIGDQSRFCGIVGKDRRMQTIFKLINDISPTDAAVLIQGESGTGKELVARAIHKRSLHRDKPFVVINCSAYPTSLLESELFGHEKGAFTGAIRQKIGRFEQADGGTVFLDEIGEIAPSAQINLLRVLQTQTFERIGGEKSLHVKVRVIAATNKDLLAEVKEGHFREDLYYRLNVIPISLPPLRKRCNDIPLLARYFLAQFKPEQGKSVKDFSTETMRRLLEHAWPGNVRELENTVEHALVLTKGDTIEVAALPSSVRMKTTSPAKDSSNTIVENERKLLNDTLEETGWNKKLTAKRLGISRSTLYNKIKKYHLTSPTIH